MIPTDPQALTALIAPLIQVGSSMPEMQWPYLPSLTRLSLALALGLLIGLERERRGKEAGLRERCYGAFEGLYYSDISQRYPAAFAAWQARDIDAAFPSGARAGESFRKFYARSVAAMLHWARRYPGQKIALVAHGGVLECAYRAALSLPLSTPRDFPVLNASVNRLRLEADVLRLMSWGEVAHLDAMAMDEVDQRVP